MIGTAPASPRARLYASRGCKHRTSRYIICAKRTLFRFLTASFLLIPAALHAVAPKKAVTRESRVLCLMIDGHPCHARAGLRPIVSQI
jgi:hypothetical protein